MPSSVRFAKVRKLLETHGWSLARIRGSHHVFTKAGESPIVIPVHNRSVKHVYVREIRKKLDVENED